MDWLEHPEMVQVFLFGDKIAVRAAKVDDEKIYNIRKQDKRAIIYNSELVQGISKLLGLDFTDRVSLTLYSVDYCHKEGDRMAIISK